MRYSLLALIGVLCLCLPCAGQTTGKERPLPADEISELREVMNVMSATSIKYIPTSGLPNTSSLKVYGLIITELKVGDPLEVTRRSVEDWNKEYAAKYGPLEVAANISQADVIFLWFVNPLSREQTPQTLNFEIPPGALLAVKSYLIVRKDAAIEVIWKDKQLTTFRKFTNTLSNAFKERMKKRRKALNK